MPGKKNPLLPNQLLKSMIFISVIVVAIMLGIIYDSFGVQLNHQQVLVESFARETQLRIDNYRFATWQIYGAQNSATDSQDSDNSTLQETRLRPDVYAPDKDKQKTEALIFGSHDSNTLTGARKASDFLDTLWALKKSTWSMYYLNGQDNSLTMVSTLPLKDMISRYNGESITGLVSARRAEMLQQANTLDERESFSGLRHMPDSGDYYFTLRTTFNQPGHLATVVAFDLPVKDMLSGQLDPSRLVFHSTENSSGTTDSGSSDRVNLASASVDLAAPLSAAPMVITYNLSLMTLLGATLHHFSFTLCLCLLLLILSLTASVLLRNAPQPTEKSADPEVDLLRRMNKEMVDSLPLGFLIYDFNAHREVVSNETASQLIPHLNLQKIVTLSDNVQGMLQVTINNEVYEVRHQQSQCSPQYCFFMIRNQDREILVNKKLQNAQRILDKNHEMRRQLLENIGNAFRDPLQHLTQQIQQIQTSLAPSVLQSLIDSGEHLARLTDHTILLNQLENHQWSPDLQPFQLQQLLDEIVSGILPAMNQRGLEIIVNNLRPADEIRVGDREILRKILLTLLWYSFGTTRWGKISVRISASPEHTDRLLINIVDTGQGLNKTELANADFPFSGEVSTLNDEKSNSMDLFFCRQFCQNLNGRLDIISKPDIGTHFSVLISLPVEQPATLREEKILDGITVLVDVVVDDIYKIVSRQLEFWGAKCLIADDRVPGQDFDFLVTDVPARLSGWALLITGSEPGYSAITPQQYRVNYNLNQAMLEALLTLIEKQLTKDEMEDAPENDREHLLSEPEYFQIFKDTVPDDVNKLYLELDNKDYAALALTAHRLKGVFAMLGLDDGKTQCEQLERLLEERDDLNIKNTTSDIEHYVQTLLQ
ncbi:phosphotransferase RcsD [Tatumella citrea]|uniref:Phosphotransferase RcsD n=1 Tax=Tatumella citrea TaxID=53336 RepID=A0A1Y0LAH2_TATCI|nr:phosphotransferase RcsD [Tatumella citrea]ARU94690.1 hypothetical protein A7K98_13545 [Tatumella citrea]ARU98728.1 hypothetical protein A7K99_13530 [Tatumella citrea]